MTLHITATVERWPVDGQFIIARGAKEYVDLLVVAVSDGQHIGYGEGTAIYYCGETAEKCLGQVEAVIPLLRDTSPRDARKILQSALSAGAARNAVDCALWDLEAKQAGVPLSELLGMKSPPAPLRTAFTISLGAPETMQADARAAAQNGYSLLKLKINGEADRDRVAAVRSGAPKGDIIVDANESWGAIDIAAEAEALMNLGVALIEQPLPAGDDAALMRELRAMGATNARVDRRHTLTGRGRFAAAAAAYEPMRRADGKLPSSWEVIYAHAWAPDPGAPIREGGHDVASVPVSAIPIRRKQT